MEPKSYLPCSQEPTTLANPEPKNKKSLCSHNIFKINVPIILSPMSGSPSNIHNFKNDILSAL